MEDKRLLVLEAEFAGTLTMMRRPGSVLFRVIRDAWDCKDLALLTKNNPTRATGPHISIIGHITVDELLAKMERTSMTNGYANRFLFACVRRARVLPHGGRLDEPALSELARDARCVLCAPCPTTSNMRTRSDIDWSQAFGETCDGRRRTHCPADFHSANAGSHVKLVISLPSPPG